MQKKKSPMKGKKLNKGRDAWNGMWGKEIKTLQSELHA